MKATHKELSYIKQEALTMEVGDTKQVHCCFCEDREPKLSITRKETGLIYNCWRIKCPAKGFIPTMPTSLWTPESKKKKKEPKFFLHDTTNLSLRLVAKLARKYHLNAAMLFKNNVKEIVDRDGILIPLRNISGYEFGHTTKYFDKKGLKAVHYIETYEVMVHYPLPFLPVHNAVLVEDCLSAMRINQLNAGWQGIALLGTHMSDDMVKAIATQYPSVKIALDNDATSKALGMKRKYGFFFESCEVIPMEEDPKALDHYDLRKVLNI